MSDTKSEIRDGMKIDWNVKIKMEDGILLSADVFRPIEEGEYPVVMSHGAYGKGLSFQEGFSTAWNMMVTEHPDTAYGSTNKYQNWEVVDPEKWVPDGYVVIRVDSRGAGRSPGYMDNMSLQEAKDLYQCIEWAAKQPWSNGKVGLNGISYYAVNQWQVASLQPPHLAAICVWEGKFDDYRDATHHGGIVCTMLPNYNNMMTRVQYGVGELGPRSKVTGELVCGDETLTEKELLNNRSNLGEDILNHPLDDDYYRGRSGQYDKINVPLLSAGNWGGQGLHLRGNIEGFVRAASKQKWLEMHGLEHWTHFYTDYGVNLQKRFFDHFLKGEDNGWDKQPPIQLQVRHVGEKFVKRYENEWPIARTNWTKFYLHPKYNELKTETSEHNTKLEFDADGDGLTFVSAPLEKEIEITGSLAAKLFVSSSTTDADLFLVFRVFTPDMREVTFHGTIDPHTPIAQGWLRASHRKLDPILSTFYRPYHTHDEKQPLKPGVPVGLDIEIWPTCIVVPAGYRIALSVRGKDYIFAEHTGIWMSNFGMEMRGSGPFLHDDSRDRKPEIFSGKTTLHFSEDMQPYVIVPIVPEKE